MSTSQELADLYVGTYGKAKSIARKSFNKDAAVEAEDVVQEAFINLLARSHEYLSNNLVYHTIDQTVIDIIRREAASKRDWGIRDAMPDDDNEDGPVDSMRRYSPSPETILLAKECLEEVWAGLSYRRRMKLGRRMRPKGQDRLYSTPYIQAAVKRYHEARDKPH